MPQRVVQALYEDALYTNPTVRWRDDEHTAFQERNPHPIWHDQELILDISADGHRILFLLQIAPLPHANGDYMQVIERANEYNTDPRFAFYLGTKDNQLILRGEVFFDPQAIHESVAAARDQRHTLYESVDDVLAYLGYNIAIG